MATTLYRISNWDTPLWANPNRRPGRYNRVPGRTTQYWALDPLTPWAEYLRFHDVRDEDDYLDLRLRVWAAEVTLPADTLQISFENAAVHGLDADALVDDNWTRCQHWADGLESTALVVPSAALPGTSNVVLFGERVRVPYSWTPIDPMREMSCDAVVEVGIGLPDLQRHVRWRGEPHAAFAAWQAGLPYTSPLVAVAML